MFKPTGGLFVDFKKGELNELQQALRDASVGDKVSVRAHSLSVASDNPPSRL